MILKVFAKVLIILCSLECTLLCSIVWGHIVLFEIFHPSHNIYTDPPILAECGHHHYQETFHCHSHPSIYVWVNSPSSSSQPFSGGTLSTTPPNFRLAPFSGSINSPTSFRVAAIFPVGHFITTPQFYANLEKYPPPAN